MSNSINSSNEYSSISCVKEFGGSSRASVKIGENFYTFESHMTKCLPADIHISEEDMTKEWDLLWTELNEEVDYQISEVEKDYLNYKNQK